MVVGAIRIVAIVDGGELGIDDEKILGKHSARPECAAGNDLACRLDSADVGCVQKPGHSGEVTISDEAPEGRIPAQCLRSRDSRADHTASKIQSFKHPIK